MSRSIDIPHYTDQKLGVTTLMPTNRAQRRRALYLIRREPKHGRKMRLPEAYLQPRTNHVVM